MLRRTLLLGSLLATAATAAHAQTARRIRGTIESVNGNTLTVKTREGETAKIVLAPNYTVNAMVPLQASAVKPGQYLGIAAMGPKERLRAVSVFVFPEAARGTAEGYGKWDLAPESTMTNAALEAEATGNDGRELTMLAKGERIKIATTPQTVFVGSEPGSPAMLKPGAKVFLGVQQAADGNLSANRVNVGKDGFTPPM